MLKTKPTIRVVTATEAKNNFGAIIKSAYASDEHLIVEKSGIPVVAIIPMADYQQLVNAQSTVQKGKDEIESARKRAVARRELSEFLKQIHAQMQVAEEDEEQAERMIQREVDAVRRARGRQMLREARSPYKKRAKTKTQK